MENVCELASADSGRLLKKEILRLEENGFKVCSVTLDAADFGVAQYRNRLFLIAINRKLYADFPWRPPEHPGKILKVRDVLAGLPEPLHFSKSKDASGIPVHANHWCMTPKSKRFFDGSLKAGYSSGRSFKTLSWDEPSIAVSYGHREVHVHPSGKRRLSVYEAMKLQGFPDNFVLHGTLSAQIDQVSEAVPPPLAQAVACSVANAMGFQAIPYSQAESSLASVDAA
jgi:DNA (cytosine-5)-methyltransferase 1